MALQIVPALDRPEDVRPLFEEYTQMLVEGDPVFASYLDLQNYEDELRHLEHKYGPPLGRLYLALWDGEVAGCIGLKPWDAGRCELKRLYVRPAFRGRHIADALTRQILDDAREIGYERMLLDTLPFLQEAIALYNKHGFREIPPYLDSPMTDAIYLEKVL